jgi:hypothetical protein
MLQIKDEKLALDFDLACATRLLFYDQELEKVRLEAMSGGAFTRAFGGGQKEYVGEITSDSVGDQSF